MQYARLLRGITGLLIIGLAACSEQVGDPHSDNGTPSPSGKDMRIAQIRNPKSPDKAKDKQPVAVSGTMVLHVDSFDETKNGKSGGTIYVQDMESTRALENESVAARRKRTAYSGTSLFAPSFIPGNYRPSAGDVLNLRGTFQENSGIGTVKFAKDAFLSQIAQPIGTFRFEVDNKNLATPLEIELADLADYAKGSQWLNMLVTVKNVTILNDLYESNGRASAPIFDGPTAPDAACEDPFPKAPTLVNELSPLVAADLRKGTKIASITGIVTFFCNLHLAPRSAKDIEGITPAPPAPGG